MEAAAISRPCVIIVIIKPLVRIPSRGFLGFSFRRSSSAGSMPIARAGRESVSRLMNSRCTGVKGTGSPIRDVYNTAKIPAVLPDSRNKMAFLIFLYTLRPFATALMIVAKLSSDRIMSAASLDTSVPVIPIATPMSAFFNAGASFTPSPVMETILPLRCHASTIRILFSGDTLA